MKQDDIETFIESLAQEQEAFRERVAQLNEQYNLAAFNYNGGRNRKRWRDVRDVDLVDGAVYLIRRVWWKTEARRSVATFGNICLARWRASAPWEVLRGNIPGSTASLAGIQVYE